MTPSEKLQKIAENEQKVFTAGENVGYSEGYNVGYEEGNTQGFDEGHAQGSAEGWQQGLDEGVNIGKSQQYDEFWDIFQQNGNRTYYSHAFRSSEWTEKILKPKYPMKPASAAYMFYSCLYSGDLTDNVQLDFSKCANFSYIFTYASLITHVGEMDTRSAMELISAFQNASGVVTIDKIILKDDGSQVVTNMFLGGSGLENVVFEGKFGNNISFSDSTKLSKASITSVINALSSSVSGKSVSLSKNAVIEAFRSGVNLLSKPYVDSTKEVNGIIFTENDDGTITANGTATADATFSVNVFQTTQNNSFALVGCPVGGSDSTYYIAYEGYGRDYGNGVMWDGTRSFWDTVTIVIKTGTKVSNLKFAPQINNINELSTLIDTKTNWTISLI